MELVAPTMRTFTILIDFENGEQERLLGNTRDYIN